MDARTGVAIGLAAWFISAGAIITYNSYKSGREIYELKEENKGLKAKNDSLLKVIDSLKATDGLSIKIDSLPVYKNIE